MSCVTPFLLAADYANSTGYIAGRFCSDVTGTLCCLPCPLTEWVYPDNFSALTTAADWIAVASTLCCVFLLISWLVLPVDKTNRHYLSICLTIGILMMNLGFIIPLAGQPDQCADAVTPNGMKSNHACAASGASIVLGGWAAVMWVFLRSLSLHVQICWQVVVGRTFMWVAQIVGWGLPLLGMVLALVLSGVSFRFGTTCHINHTNSLAVLWIPLLAIGALSIVVQLVTFGYCIKVYLASLADNSASTENSGLPSYSNSIRTMTPRQAYRRVRRVIQLQWRGIAIVLIIVTDVIFFSIVFVFQDNTVAAVSRDASKAESWLFCLAANGGDKSACLHFASNFTVSEATIGAVLVLLAMNGFWLLILLGRWSMVLGWIDLVTPSAQLNAKREFVSVDARMDDLKKDTRSYEMLSRDISSSALEAGGPKAALGTTVTTTASPILKKDHDGATSPTGVSRAVAGRSNTMSPIRSPSSLSGRGQRSHSQNQMTGFDRVTPLGRAASGQAKSGFDDDDEDNEKPAPLMDLHTAAMGGAAVMNAHTSHGRYNSHGSFTFNNNTTSSINTPSRAASPPGGVPSGRRTPDYFGQTARYNAPARSFSNPRPPTSSSMNSPPGTSGGGVRTHARFDSRGESRTRNASGHAGGNSLDDIENRHPLGMNRI